MLRSRNMWNVWMVVMVVVLMAAASTHAAITTWNAGGDGTRWSDSGNWSGAVPGGTDTAVLWGNAEGGSTITVYIEEGDQAVNNIETFRGVVLEGTDQDDATERKLTLNGNITGVLGASSHSGTVQIKCDLELTGDTVWDVTARAGSTIAVSRVVSETVQSDITIRNTGVTSTTDSTFSADPTITGDLIILEGRTQALVTGWGSTLNSIILGDTTGDKDVVLATGNGQSIVAPIVVRAGSSGYRGIQVGHTWSGGSLTGPTIALGGDLTFVNNGPLTVSNTMSGVGGVVQNGATTIGTRLTADNTYQGDTDVTKGVLIVAGTTSGQGDYIVRADGSLTGDGQIGLASGKTVTVQSGGTLLPGNSTSTRVPLTTQSVGELTIDGDLVLLDGAELEFQLGNDVVAGTDYDTVTLLSDLTLDGTLNVTQKTGFDATTGVYTLFSGVDTLTNNGLETSGLDGIDHWIDTTQTGFVYLRTGETAPISNPIPEPAGLGLIGLALLAVRRKRRKETTVTKGLKNTWIVALVVALGLAFAPVTMAETWSGGGGDDLWSTGANWGGTAPSSGSTTALIFDGSTRLTPDQDIASPFAVNSLTFAATASSFDVQGSTLRFDGVTPSITQSSANAQMVTAPVRENGVGLTIDVSGGKLTLDDAILKNGITKNGTGTVELINQSTDRDQFKDIVVNNGTVIVTNGVGSKRDVYGTLTVGDGIGAAESAVFRFGSPTVLTNTAGPIEVFSDGLYDLDGFSDGPYLYPFELHTGAVITGDKAGGGGTIRVGSCTTPATNTAKVVVGAGNTVQVAAATWTIHRGGDPSGIDMEVLGAVIRNGSARGFTFLKNGNGTLRLANGITDYRSRVQVDDGVLILSGTFSTIDNVNTDVIAVNAGGTLAGNVTFAPTNASAGPQEIRINAGGTLAPGESIGVMTMNTVNGTEQMIFDGTVADPSVLSIELAGAASYDQLVVVDGILRLNGPAGAGVCELDVDLLGFNPSPADTFVVVQNSAGTIVGTFANDMGGQLVTDVGTFDITYAGGDGNDVVLSNFSGEAIPEPAGLSLLGLVLVGLRRRRR